MTRRIVLPWLLAVTVGAAGSCAPPPPPFKPVADLKQLMASVVEPAADVYWDAVGTIIDANGVTEIEPRTLEEWETVVNAAYTVTESGNLMMIGSRVRSGGDWMALSQALIESGRKAIRAAEARDKTGVFDAGAELYEACTACHAIYAIDVLRPNTQ
ncbi:MAG: hypothetical protein ACT4QD_11290 [Acidobacteriota bacterium]